MTHLVFFCGHAGTGKTTLAKRLIGPLMRATGEAFCLPRQGHAVRAATARPRWGAHRESERRDSPLYPKHLRDPEYQGRCSTRPVKISRSASARSWSARCRAKCAIAAFLDRAWLGIAPDVTLTVVWVHTSEDVAHQRIVARGNPNDAYKLAHWDEYRQRRFVPTGHECDGIVMFDNTAPSDADVEAAVPHRAASARATIVLPLPA